MKKFIIKSLIFFCIVVGILSYILINYGGNVDYFYEKFTTPKAHSLILGDSRSMQGIQPSVIDNYFKNSTLELPMFNYSFTLGQIAYGEPYNQSVQRKLNMDTKNGLFIITVHPFTLSSRSRNLEEDNGEFFEANLPPHNMHYVNMNPNFEYFFKNFEYFHFRGIFRQSSKTHKDGWMEEKNLPDDPKLLQQWKQGQITLYTKYSSLWEKSPTRLRYLEKLIEDLKKHGNVFLVRLPIAKELLEIEDKYWSTFNTEISFLEKKYNVNYINFNTATNPFQTYDGIHIDKFAGVHFTEVLCDSINKYLD